jgi:membrane fusion protein, copper/silver efflux system
MKKTTTLSLILLALALALGCDKGKDAAQSTSTAAGADAPAVLATYEAIRDLLAKDETSGLGDKAAELQQKSSAAAASAPAGEKPKLESLAKAAGELKAKAGDIEAARKQFGEVSRHLVELLVENPKLQEGRHVFECPMAQGYTKWVQTKPEVENPYMGKKMLDCGGKTDWKS